MPRVVVLTLLFSAAAFAQNLRVIPVPWVADAPSVPHFAYNGHATTFKAIARGGNGTYLVEWDFQGDGLFDVSFTAPSRYDLSARFTYPNQAQDVTFVAKVRVTSNGQSVVGSYPVRVISDVPANPANATDRQLQVMRNVSVDDALWYLHTQMTRTGDAEHPLTGAQATGSLPAPTYAVLATASFLEALGRQGHFAAFPPAYVGAMPNPGVNAARWSGNPYSEDAMRAVNYLLALAYPVSVPPIDESNLTGFYPEVSKTPVPGSDDGFGVYVGLYPGSNSTGGMSTTLRAMSAARLTGYVAQVGDANRVLGRKLEFLVQQMVDALVWAQNEGTYVGAWYYTPNGGNDLLGELTEGTMDAAEALHAAETFMGVDGVIVPNHAKTRLLQYIVQNSNTCPQGGTGGSWMTVYDNVCDLSLSAAHVHALGWVGANLHSTADSRLAFPSYSALTAGQLRSLYDSTVAFISATFLSTVPSSIGWDIAFVEGGDFDRTDGLGNFWAMNHWARASRAVTPDVVAYGVHGWERLFSRFLVNNQLPNGDFRWAFGSNVQNHNDNGIGPLTRGVWATLVLMPDARPARVDLTATSLSSTEGMPITFTATSDLPGTVTWSFGNGDTGTGSEITYPFPDNGSFTVTATLTTAAGAVSVDSRTVTIANASPVVTAPADLSVDEGTPVLLAGQVVDPGSADTFTYAWVFGDGTANGTTATVSHTYADNGSFIAALTATDDDGAPGADEVLVTVVNVAPSITSTAQTNATEGSPYSYSLTFVDPGVSDTHTCSAVRQPSGATLAGCDVIWTPTGAEAGAPAEFELCVSDDDDGRSCQQFNVTISFLDSDGDGLADSWETLWFGAIAAQDQFGDPDSDGLNNAVEFAAGSNPTLYDGPSAPGAQSPACGSTVSSLQPTLSVVNATDPQGASLLYTFELYSDAALTQLVASNDAVAAGTTSTSWQVPSPLVENRSYFWRAKARDPNASGNYTAPACALRVNVADELPSAPAHDSPDLGGNVATLQPTLSVQNASDPDGDALTYEFEVRLAEVVAASASGVAQASGVTSWQVSTPLVDGNTYRWRARASSAGGSGPWSPYAQFTVRASFAAAGEPVIVSPQNGTVVDSLSPTLVFLPSGGSSPFDWQLASDDSFATLTASGEDSTATAVTLPQPLVEDGRYCWRVRSDNGATQSAWVKACFRVSAVDDAPSVPTPFNPAGGSVVTTASPIFTWAAATDPEGDAVSYEVELTRGSEVKVISGVGGTAAVSSEPLTNGDYSWRVRAVASGGSSAYSTPSAFSVAVAPVVEQPEASGCGGCSSTSGAFAPMLIAVLGVLRRRRR